MMNNNIEYDIKFRKMTIILQLSSKKLFQWKKYTEYSSRGTAAPSISDPQKPTFIETDFEGPDELVSADPQKAPSKGPSIL